MGGTVRGALRWTRKIFSPRSTWSSLRPQPNDSPRRPRRARRRKSKSKRKRYSPIDSPCNSGDPKLNPHPNILRAFAPLRADRFVGVDSCPFVFMRHLPINWLTSQDRSLPPRTVHGLPEGGADAVVVGVVGFQLAVVYFDQTQERRFSGGTLQARACETLAVEQGAQV